MSEDRAPDTERAPSWHAHAGFRDPLDDLPVEPGYGPLGLVEAAKSFVDLEHGSEAGNQLALSIAALHLTKALRGARKGDTDFLCDSLVEATIYIYAVASYCGVNLEERVVEYLKAKGVRT